MALRIPFRVQLTKAQPCVAVGARFARRGLSTTSHKAAVTNPDPTDDSPSAALVAEHAPYMVATYARPPPVFVKGEGSWIWDIENRKYLDFTAGIAVNALGHCDPEITKLAADQAATLVHASNLYYNPWTGALSKLLVEKTRAAGAMHDANAVFICNSGSEANEAAIKFARKTGKQIDPSGNKTDIVSFHNAFHGRTMGSLSATHNPKYQQPFAPMLPGFRVGTLNDIDAIDALVTDKTCGVIVEPIQGEGGVTVATDAFLTALAKRCRAVGAVLIYDEIQCGLGRTGTFWAHAHLPKEAHPDILTTAKALGNGFPIGATLVNAHVADKDQGRRSRHHLWRQPPGVAPAGRPSSPRSAARASSSASQLSQDPTPIVKAARERGLLVITAGTNTLRFVPPLTITDSEIQQGLDVLEEAIVATVA
ncbi:acetylornithine aminotransferase [Verticillium alfalfae VaMs.102]|uniref:Acetylornithine aminotransferase n=1 Tax=Verticillium alfalfae (strain VaMs.102 / ATCC MYA-4576 / FGSC 10136) TaxID=526221 RepID=C9SJR8_VERA1|nr:acetylornithine aminotransferase [Verticillium alfalfae VaMs.102]EEY19682.1 acetylornithine aminotransferase [Verticillium alfalfae VaMs.102]